MRGQSTDPLVAVVPEESFKMCELCGEALPKGAGGRWFCGAIYLFLEDQISALLRGSEPKHQSRKTF